MVFTLTQSRSIKGSLYWKWTGGRVGVGFLDKYLQAGYHF